jgi:hypothetical protein
MHELRLHAAERAGAEEVVDECESVTARELAWGNENGLRVAGTQDAAARGGRCK